MQPDRAGRFRRLRRAVLLGLLVLAMLYSAKIVYSVVHWKAYGWLPAYWNSASPDRLVPDPEKHLIFVMADHYEPGFGAKGAEVNRQWLEDFRPIAQRHRDSSGNTFRYTWFYPYDHKNEEVLASLSEMAYRGYGEVELHWHHPPADTKTFPGMLEEALAWFRRYGALVSSGPDGKTHFAFIHGNWCLDDSVPGICGVNRELDILFQHGCYADFTFSTVGTLAQPRKVNAIYYATDDDGTKSYDDGDSAEVGKPVDDRLMIFEGPLGIDWLGHFEYGAVEKDILPGPSRVPRWIDANVHVLGRPEWVFVKVYSHGAQSAEAIVQRDLDPMLTWIEDTCRQRGIALHYMTAREAYNVVKAAEDGKRGDPEPYRDYRIPKPVNMVRPVNPERSEKAP